MTSTDQMWFGIVMVCALVSAAWITSDTEEILIEINKVQSERILRQEVYVDTLIKWVEDCYQWQRDLPESDSLSLKQASNDSVQSINLKYRNLNLYLTRYPPDWSFPKLLDSF